MPFKRTHKLALLGFERIRKMNKWDLKNYSVFFLLLFISSLNYCIGELMGPFE